MVLRRVVLGVLRQRRIDVEHHRHLARLARLEALLGEAEAVDLLEVGADGRRRHVVGRLPGGRARGLVGDRDNARSPPRRCATLISFCSGSNCHGRPGVTLASKRTVTVRSSTCPAPRRDLRGAAEAGGAAEPVVERHRGIGRADHQRDERAAARGDDEVAAQSVAAGRALVLIAAGSGRPGPSPG